VIAALRTVRLWFDSHAAEPVPAGEGQRVDWLRVVPLVLAHLACLGVLWVGWSPVAVGIAVALYLVRMFAITAFYHRYFSHASFRAGRLAQLAFAVLGAAAAQRGALWWAAHHRHHHATSDRPEDVHSPVRHGFLWSHIGWLTARANFRTRLEYVPDLARFPELRFLDRFDTLVPALLALGLFLLGAVLARLRPDLGTGPWQMLVWGFFVSTVVLLHATCTINSLAHLWGSRRFPTRDRSRNNPWLALLTLGEGWHNNHHHYPASTRQGFYWWEIDPTWYALAALQAVGVVHDLKPVPERVRAAGRTAKVA
jgi:stearoyl-CoA desaturase (delta-9 desaturase)